MNTQGLRRGLTMLVVVILTGCAGGGETGTGVSGPGPGSGPVPTPIPTPPPSSKKDISIGAITATAPGSVWVNGVQFQAPATTVTLDGVLATTGDLGVGMVAAVKGIINADGVSGTADTIMVKKVIKGPVSSATATYLTVLSQTIQIDELTTLPSGVTLDNTLIGQYVEVSGVIKSSGVIVATRVDVVPALGTYQVDGVTTSLNVAAKTVNIGNLIINYAALSNLPPGIFNPANPVEVSGKLDNGVFIASALESVALAEQEARRIEMQGCVMGASPDFDSFGISHVIVWTPPGTSYTGGLANQIVNGTCVEVEGALAAGEVTATHITLKNKARLESNVASIDTNSFTLNGFPGLTVSVDSETQYGGVASFDAIFVSGHVKVRGRYDPGTATLLATHIDAPKDPSNDVVVRNYVEGPIPLVSPNITLLGVVLDISGAASFTGGSVTSLADFFDIVLPGYVVELQGTSTGSVVTWKQVNYED